jgi:hypothetical protein
MTSRTLALLGCLAIVAVTPCGAGDVQVSHLYELSDFNGTVPYSDAILHADRQHDEIYAVVGNNIRVFNETGMEIYRFQHDAVESKILDLVVDESGDILTLNLDPQAARGTRSWWINRCDYRGDVTGRIEISGLPTEIEHFTPNRMSYRGGQFVLLSTSGLQAVTMDRSGAFRKLQDLAELFEIENPDSTEIAGFSIDRSGNMLFTIPTLFRAFVVAPDETVRMFGTPGSAPGKFGIVAGIVADDHGHYVIVDKLRRVVMVFDSSFSLVTEFAGSDRWALARPTVLVLGNSGRLYVTQSQQRGVAVLGLSSASNDRTFDLRSSISNSVDSKTGLQESTGNRKKD